MYKEPKVAAHWELETYLQQGYEIVAIFYSPVNETITDPDNNGYYTTKTVIKNYPTFVLSRDVVSKILYGENPK